MPRNTQTLIVVRHAHRDTESGREFDNGLSEKGKLQAQKVLELFLSRYGKGIQPALLSSPSRRCRETLEPIAKALKIPVQNVPELQERNEDTESEKQFRKRIENFAKRYKDDGLELEILSSHGDWIPLFLDVIGLPPIPLKKAGWAEIRWKKEEPVLWYLQQDVL